MSSSDATANIFSDLEVVVGNTKYAVSEVIDTKAGDKELILKLSQPLNVATTATVKVVGYTANNAAVVLADQAGNIVKVGSVNTSATPVLDVDALTQQASTAAADLQTAKSTVTNLSVDQAEVNTEEAAKTFVETALAALDLPEGVTYTVAYDEFAQATADNAEVDPAVEGENGSLEFTVTFSKAGATDVTTTATLTINHTEAV